MRAIKSGRYATVYREGNKAIKVLPKKRHDIHPKVNLAMIEREIRCWKAVSGKPHILELLDVREDQDNVYLVSPLRERDVAEALNEGIVETTWDPRTVVPKVIHTVLQGLHACHEKGIVHGDIKPANVLLRSPQAVELCDFGCSRWIAQDGDRARCASFTYGAPEVLSAGEGTFSADMWSVGVLTYRLLMLEGSLDTQRISDRRARSFVDLCLDPNPAERLTSHEALSFPWFNT